MRATISRIALASSVVGGVMLEAERKSEWDEINRRYAGLFEASNAELKALLDAGDELAGKLEAKYGVAFIKVTP